MSRRLQASMDTLAKKRQKEYDEMTKWSNQIRYYKSWDRHNNKYQTWTSSEYYDTSLDQYKAMKNKEQKKIHLEARRDKLRKLFFGEEQEHELEIQCSPRISQRHNYKLNETPLEVLKDVNLGLKIAEDDRRRHEAELKLYQQWKNNNPIIRDFEVNQNRSGLKLAWLDQQIEKRMKEEKTAEEMKKLIEQRDKLIQEEERLEKLEREQQSLKEKQFMTEIDLQIQHFKLKEEEAQILKREEEKTLRKKLEIEDILLKTQQDLQLRRNRDISLYNINQSKLKLRKKASEVAEQLKKEQKLIEDIIASKTAEEIEDQQKRYQTKNSIHHFLQFVRDQRLLEAQRQKYVSFIFDSEAKTLWQKQERQWQEEQRTRDKLFKDVLEGLHKQIADKHIKNVEKQQILLKEREEMLQSIEEHDRQMKRCKEDLTQKTIERKMELDKQVNEKCVMEYEKKVEEDEKKKEELDNIRKEEEKLKYELIRMQRRHFPQQRFNRRIIW